MGFTYPEDSVVQSQLRCSTATSFFSLWITKQNLAHGTTMLIFVFNYYSGTMQVTLEINGDKALSILEVLKNIKGVKVTSVTPPDVRLKKKQLNDAFQQTEQAEQGKIKLKTFDELLSEL